MQLFKKNYFNLFLNNNNYNVMLKKSRPTLIGSIRSRINYIGFGPGQSWKFYSQFQFGTNSIAHSIIVETNSVMAPKAKGKATASQQPPLPIEDLFTNLNRHIERSEFEQAVKVADQGIYSP